MNNRVVKKVLATMLAATLLTMPIVAGATDQAEPAQTQEQKETITPAATPINAGGTVIKSDVPGAYSVGKTGSSGVTGFVVRQSTSALAQAAGLAKNEKPFVSAYDINAKKSPAAFASFQGAAAATGGTVMGGINVNLAKIAGGKLSELPAGTSVPATFAVSNKGGKTLAVAKVLPGGATEILKDQDDNPNTVTVPITAGPAAYGIIGY
ncbi:MAG: hypothetical protein J6N21_12845 [Butyrivibrio sp.]|nr:hypothetical protein [Butyrivibrio sp.]